MSHVFTVQAKATIAAPAADVWPALLDFKTYSEWNPFVRSFIVTDASGGELEPGTLPSAGQKIVMRTNMPPTLTGPGSREVRCDITHFDHDAYRACWANNEFPSWFLRTERWSVLTQEELEDGTKQTVYETQEAFAGWGAYLVKWFVGTKVQQGFTAMANALKDRVEARPPVPAS
ncbi:hypothetical protein EXIGLDRAFT_611926 [Exidia glandulosa HHB12029]|uniref:SRPBCC domain-containing protein n=1 Tax=Exidia glandulosa HHB12029 TaxID=1314781 RepID=A0A165J223_EXIGL|nr:hypothetical protein EXIGLDRAFT_611926 [Exidia glandulosa HHB12029]